MNCTTCNKFKFIKQTKVGYVFGACCAAVPSVYLPHLKLENSYIYIKDGKAFSDIHYMVGDEITNCPCHSDVLE